MQSRYISKQDPRMQSAILHRDTIVETRVDVLVFAHGPRLRSTSTAHGIGIIGSLNQSIIIFRVILIIITILTPPTIPYISNTRTL